MNVWKRIIQVLRRYIMLWGNIFQKTELYWTIWNIAIYILLKERVVLKCEIWKSFSIFWLFAQLALMVVLPIMLCIKSALLQTLLPLLGNFFSHMFAFFSMSGPLQIWISHLILFLDFECQIKQKMEIREVLKRKVELFHDFCSQGWWSCLPLSIFPT